MYENNKYYKGNTTRIDPGITESIVSIFNT